MKFRDYILAITFMMIGTFVPYAALSGIHNKGEENRNYSASLTSGYTHVMNENIYYALLQSKASVESKGVYETALGNIEHNDELGEEEIENEKAAEEERERIEAEEKAKEEAEQQIVVNNGANVPNEDPNCKSYSFVYMYGMNITSTGSNQYKFLHNGLVHADENGYLVDEEGRYLVAVGTFFADNIGDKIDVLFDDGTILKCVVGDFKSDRHTDISHRYYAGYNVPVTDDSGGIVTDADGNPLQEWHQGDGSVLEFILDYDTWNGTRLPEFQSVHRIQNITNITKEGIEE